MGSKLDPKLTKRFRAKLEASGTSLHWVIVRVPVDLRKAWPTWKSRRVFGEINGFTLIVNKKMQAAAGVRAGGTAEIRLAPDLGELVIDTPVEFARILKDDRDLKRWFEALSPSMRKGFMNLIADAKTPETRQKRAEQMAESLVLAMEGEIEPPPILRVAFQRQPDARRGWELMTPTQRKHHLLGIFYPQTVNGRERRVATAIENCIAVARRKTSY